MIIYMYIFKIPANILSTLMNKLALLCIIFSVAVSLLYKSIFLLTLELSKSCSFNKSKLITFVSNIHEKIKVTIKINNIPL